MGANVVGIQTGGHGHFDQNIQATDETPFDKIGIQQALFDLIAQPVVRLAGYLV